MVIEILEAHHRKDHGQDDENGDDGHDDLLESHSAFVA
jgi:hypothetical protein